ncbi:mitochondrial import inner membrane translocase subunit Tim21-like [Periophthalmus magnuspinnatus]|uniref:Mitochondrial import inner membrane translocase subunit Tim21 n=1 Tax=Periophthalmus magnuspinnatus TaxID=409849 RepID=A0A3B3ZQB2_9GOBI|nr:mitochondrial import inner membrane translocase subunit Tim21-like [Periophthalmus magnuspinnatus]
MAYARIFKALSHNLPQTASRYMIKSCKLGHVRFIGHTDRVFSTSRSPFERTHSDLCTVSFIHSIKWRGISVDCTKTNKSSPEESRGKSVSRFQGGSPQASAAQKVKDAGRDFTYLIVVLIGLGVTGGLLYVLFQELFSSSSPNKVYGKAFNLVKSNPEVIGAFGEPIKCYGETTRRGRRQHVSHLEFLKDGLKHLRLKFYIEGSEPGIKGTVHSESKENPETGRYEFRYIFVEVDTYPRRTIIVEDNR